MPLRDKMVKQELVENDMVILNIAGKELFYKVKSCYVVEPEEAEKITPVLDKDLLTLITCTPWGINTKRLIIDCERSSSYKKTNIHVKRYIIFGVIILFAVKIVNNSPRS